MRNSVTASGSTAASPTRVAITTVAIGLIGALLRAGSVGAQAVKESRAHTSWTLGVKDEGKLAFVKSSGSTIIEEGPAHGTLPGTVKLHFVYNGNPTVTSQLAFHGRGGTIQAHATGRLSSPTSATPSFSGTLTITSGTGHHHGAHATGRRYGVFYRRTYAVIPQTEGSLSY